MHLQLQFLLSLLLLLIAPEATAQKATAYTEFHGTKAKTTVQVDDDLFVRFSLEKSLEETAKEQGIEVGDKLYGLVKMRLSKMEVTTGAFVLANKQNSSLKEFDLIFSVVMKQFQILTTEKKAEWTAKDELMLNALAQANNTRANWMKLIAGRAIGGQTQEAEVELYLVKDAETKTSKGSAICSGAFKVKVTDEALHPMYGSRIPVLYRPTPDDGMVNDLHKKNIGNILWANEAITKGEHSTAALKTSFIAQEDGIYGRIYLAKSLRNIGAGLGYHQDRVCAYTILYYIDDQLAGSKKQAIDRAICQSSTSLPIVLAKHQADESPNEALAQDFGAALEKITEGEHKISVVVNFDYKEADEEKSLQIATSEFVIRVKEKE